MRSEALAARGNRCADGRVFLFLTIGPQTM